MLPHHNHEAGTLFQVAIAAHVANHAVQGCGCLLHEPLTGLIRVCPLDSFATRHALCTRQGLAGNAGTAGPHVLR